MERRQILSEFTVVGTISAAIVVSMLNWIHSLFDPAKLVGWRMVLIPILAATGTYLLVFKLAIWIYYNAIWRLVHAKRYLAGEWTYRYNDSYDSTKDAWEPGANRCGVAYVDHTAEDISIHGESLENPGANPGETTIRATWQSRASAMQEDRIYLFSTVTSGIGTEDAFFILQVTPRPKLLHVIPRAPAQIKGHYYIPPKSSIPTRYARIEFKRT